MRDVLEYQNIDNRYYTVVDILTNESWDILLSMADRGYVLRALPMVEDNDISDSYCIRLRGK